MQQLIFPDKEQFYEEVSGYNSDGNLARRDAKHGGYDFSFLLPMNSKKNNFRYWKSWRRIPQCHMTSWQLLALSPTARTHRSCWAKDEIENERFGLVGKKISVLIEIKLKQNNIYCNDNKKISVSSRVRFKTNTFSLQHTQSLRCCKYLIKDTFQELEDWKGWCFTEKMWAQKIFRIKLQIESWNPEA